jgi:hypothetical protein
MKRLLTIVTLSLLASCGPKKELTAQEVAAAMTKRPQIIPGEWRSTITLISADGPGVSDADRKSVAQPNVLEACVKPDTPQPTVDTFLNTQAYQDCKYYAADIGDTHMHFNSECNTKIPGERITVDMTGTLSPTISDTTSSVVTTSAAHTVTTTIKLRMLSERIGACPGP